MHRVCSPRFRGSAPSLSLSESKMFLESKMGESCRCNARSVAQDIGKRTSESRWLREFDDVSVDDDVSLLCRRSGGVKHRNNAVCLLPPSSTPENSPSIQWS